MTGIDDRAAFEEKKRVQALALGRARTFEAAVDALQAADKYDYPYLWSWIGVPIVQLPADIIATQEIIWATKPDLIVETGWPAAVRCYSWHRSWNSSVRAR